MRADETERTGSTARRPPRLGLKQPGFAAVAVLTLAGRTLSSDQATAIEAKPGNSRLDLSLEHPAIELLDRRRARGESVVQRNNAPHQGICQLFLDSRFVI